MHNFGTRHTGKVSSTVVNYKEYDYICVIEAKLYALLTFKQQVFLLSTQNPHAIS